MNIVVDRARLNSEIAFISPACRHQQAGWLLLTADNGQLVLSTHNSSSATSASIPATIEVPGEVCVPSRALPQVVASLDRGTSDVALAVVDGRLDMRWHEFHAQFQPIQRKNNLAISTEATVSCDATHLRRAIEMVTNIAGPSHNVLVGANEAGVIVAATDGRRLTEVVFGVKPAETFVVAAHCLGEIRSALLKGKTAVISRGRHVSVSCDGRKVGMPLAATAFPAYEQIFAGKLPSYSLGANVEALLGAMTRVTMADDTDSAITLEAINDEIWISSWHKGAREGVINVNKAAQVLDAMAPPPDSVPIVTLNGNYVADSLRSMEVEQCEVVITAATDPVIVRPLHQVEYSFRSAIMPVRK